jgi:predicted NAD-dependent protein-ADP-ribosyltransferase YbiA (DUF1768 family)
MRAIIKQSVLVFVGSEPEESASFDALLAQRHGHVFELVGNDDEALVFRDLGPRSDACREPINIGSRVANPQHAIISNFAATPFVLDGRPYASVEGFWQSLRFRNAADRRRVAALSGGAAKRAGDALPWGATLRYEGETIAVGRAEHWKLMERACEAKFRQNAVAQAGLLSTGARPLTHRMRHDSRSIPGIIMADIWMRIRDRLGRSERTPTR